MSAPVVRRIFELRLAGNGAKRIANVLNTEGVLCPAAQDPARNRHRDGLGWRPGTVLSLLSNPRYIGR